MKNKGSQSIMAFKLSAILMVLLSISALDINAQILLGSLMHINNDKRQNSESRTFEYAINTTDLKSIEMTNVIGNITIRTHQEQKIIVELNKNFEGKNRIFNKGDIQDNTNGLGYFILEKDDMVSIENLDLTDDVKLRQVQITIPEDVALSMKMYGELLGTLNINGFAAPLEIDGQEFAVDLRGLSETLILSTYGEINASFKTLTANAHISIVSLGLEDLNLELSTQQSASVQIQSELGKIVSDFEVNPNQKKARNIEWGAGLYGSINGGGNKVILHSIEGNIHLKKK